MPGIDVSPSLLSWAREQVGLSRKDAAGRLHISEERLERWETGDADDRPSWTHLQSMSTLYGRPIATFFLESPPPTFQPPDDYRFRTVGGQTPHLSRELRVQIRRAREWQGTVGDIMRHRLDFMPPVNIPSFTIEDDPEEVGRITRLYVLDVQDSEQLDWRNREQAFFQWRDRIESRGVLVFAMQFNRELCRGFSLMPEGNGPPVICLASEGEQARIFTMLHEFAHVMLNRSGICTEIPDPSERGQVERFCNQVAAAALMPESLLDVTIAKFGGVPQDLKELDWAALKPLADSMWVSVPALALRLEETERAPRGIYIKVTTSVPERERTTGGGGGPSSWPGVRISERGASFSHAIFAAWEAGFISRADAARAMNMPAKYVEFIGESTGRRRRRLA